MKTTAFFDNSVMLRRPFLTEPWIEDVIQNFICKEVQPNGRIRMWGYIDELGKYLRVVTEVDGLTVHNAFPDRGFKPEEDK